MIGKVMIEIEPREVSLLLLFQFIDLELRKEHAAFGMVGMRQGKKTAGPRVFFTHLLRSHASELIPSNTFGQEDTDAFLHGFTAKHRYSGGGIVAQVVSSGEEILVFLLDRRLLCRHALQG